jgi:hypothetical protein
VTWTYDLSTDVGRCRLMVPDRIQAEAIFSDEEYAAFLDLEGDIRRATALALETIAADEALVQKVQQFGDFRTDGAKTADSLLKRAATLRSQASDADAAEDGGAWDIAEMVTGPFGYRERLYNEALRDG